MKSKWIGIGNVLTCHAEQFSDKTACCDKSRSLTFAQWNARSCRLAHALTKLGCSKGDRFAVMAYNRIEWLEIYAGCAKGGQICVPLMFRLAAPEIEFIINDSDAKVLIIEESFLELFDSIKKRINIPDSRIIFLNVSSAPSPDNYVDYEDWLSQEPAAEPETVIDAADPWMIMYTSGTTGSPKGVVRSHESYIAQNYIHGINMGARPNDKALIVMPLCHVNSIFYSFAYALVSASVYIYNECSFDPRQFLELVQQHEITFVSLVPTHYVMVLGLPEDVKQSYDVGSMRQLLISSAPARKSTKLGILNFFKNAELWEAYGSTEAGLVTLCRPEDQLTKLGTIGREVFGIDQIKVLDEDGKEVPQGQIGELYSRTPMMFSGYWKRPQLTKEVFRGEWFTAGDMCYKDSDGFYVLVDRKSNMIITGGENVFPSEVERAIISHPAVTDVAVIGIPHDKWGEAVHAVIVLNNCAKGKFEELREELRIFLKQKIAGHKVPKTFDFIEEADMPRTGTGKILHRVLREKYGRWSEMMNL